MKQLRHLRVGVFVLLIILVLGGLTYKISFAPQHDVGIEPNSNLDFLEKDNLLDTATTTSNLDDAKDSNTTLEGNDVDVPNSPVTAVPKPLYTFSGELTEVNNGCFADGECFAVVGGKHVTLNIGRNQEVLGSISGVKSIGDLELYIGDIATVYAKPLPDGTYTLYGNASYYLAVTPKPTSGCVTGGCSGQLCVRDSDEPAATTCEWREEYACYQTAKCEMQSTGQCGWTQTSELQACILGAN